MPSEFCHLYNLPTKVSALPTVVIDGWVAHASVINDLDYFNISNYLEAMLDNIRGAEGSSSCCIYDTIFSHSRQ